MTALRLLAVLALALTLLLLALHPLRFTHATWGNALCACPVCVVTSGMWEISAGEYC